MIKNSLLNKFKNFIYHNLGIHYPSEKEHQLQIKFSKLENEIGEQNLETFYERLEIGDKESINHLINLITINHTFFFREKEHLRILAEDIKTKKLSYPIIWSAASSTGEEVYSIVITLLENGIRNFLIVASDLNRKSLHAVKNGVYSIERLSEMEKMFRLKYFDKISEEKFAVKKELKNNTVLKQINLVKPVHFEKKFDYIFCRNVMIYFDNETKKRVINNLLNNLKKDGYLFVGFTESLFNITNKVKNVSTAVYTHKEKE